MPETGSKQKAVNSLACNTIICPRCVAFRVAKSRLRGLDKLRMKFYLARPYRCLHCYHRFWAKENSTAGMWSVWGRAIGLLVVLSLIVLLLARVPQDAETTEKQTQGNSSLVPAANKQQIVTPEPVIVPVGKVQRTDPTELATASENVKEHNRYLSESGDESGPNEAANTVLETNALLGESNQGGHQVDVALSSEERESLLKVTMARHMTLWSDAWQNADIKAYLGNYSVRFVPSKGQTQEQWRATRIKRIKLQKEINLALSDFQVSFSEDYQTIAIIFNQRYQSNTYFDNSQKRMVWVKEVGSWKIASEREIE